MNYSEFTDKHIATLNSRIKAAGLTPKRTRAFAPTGEQIVWMLEKQCVKAGLSIEIEPPVIPTVFIDIWGEVTNFHADAPVKIRYLDRSNVKSNGALIAFSYKVSCIGKNQVQSLEVV